MSIFKRLLYCTRSLHEVAPLTNARGLAGAHPYQFITLDGGGTVFFAMTYFRCKHCHERFRVPGLLGAVADRRPRWRAEAISRVDIPDDHLAELAKTPWWPEKAVPGGIGSGGGYHGPTLDPLMPDPVPPKTTGAPKPISYMESMLEMGLREIAATWVPSSRRQLKDRVYSHIADSVAVLGTCCRLKVGCVLLTEDGALAGTGYNGAGPGMPHCDPKTCNANCRCSRTQHAEINALTNCTGKPYTAYVTHECCVACAKELIMKGVRRVVYGKPYTSMSPEEHAARQEWIDHYNVSWTQLPETK